MSGPGHRLNEIETCWTVVCRAHGQASMRSIQGAQEQLLDRYGNAVQRYLLASVRDADAAEELFQEFSLRFVRGDLKGVDRQRGRFRDFLKGVLFHLIGDYHRRQRKQPATLSSEHEPAAETSDAADDEFLASWRSEVMKRAWSALQTLEQQGGQPYYVVLHCRVSHPAWQSDELARAVGREIGKPVNAAWLRQNLHRAREKFAEALVNEVAQTLRDPGPAELEQELVDLGLIKHCRAYVEKLKSP
jgi:RNA polymerase sigma-70 factor (ECF subfamily)